MNETESLVDLADFEVRTSRTKMLNLTRGGEFEVVRVEWRRVGTRRWSKANVIPEDGQTLDQVEALAPKVVQARETGEPVNA